MRTAESAEPGFEPTAKKAPSGKPRNPLLEAALTYAATGIPVHPCYGIIRGACECKAGAKCTKPGKHPRITGWPDTSSTDPKQIREWWATWPNSNVGLAMGRYSALMVLDVDGEKGRASIADHEAEHGPLPETVTAISGGGDGFHLYFLYPGDEHAIGNRASEMAPGLDTRVSGGQVVAPPSKHASGGTYRWAEGRAPREVPFAPVPPALLEMMKPRAKPEHAAPPPPAPPKANGHDTAPWAEAALRAEAEAVARATEGRRNHQLNASAFSLGQIVGGGHLDDATVRAELLAAADRSGIWREDGPEQCRKTFESGFEKGKLEPRDPPEREPARVRASVRARGRAAPSSPPPPRPGVNGAAFAELEPVDAADLVHLEASDTGNADRLIARFGRDLMWTPHAGWHAWDGTRWRLDERKRAVDLAQRTARLIFEECPHAGDKEDQERRAKWAVSSQNKSRVDGMLAMAEPHLSALPDDLDADGWALNVTNGTLDLRTGELRPHRREDRITKLAPVAYDQAAPCRRWRRFLLSIFRGNRRLVRFLRRAIGYSLTGETVEQIMLILHGGGSNGKSTLIEVLAAMLGDYAQQTPVETLMVKDRTGAVPVDLARLKGARFVSAAENDKRRRLSESVVKHITGGDRVPACFKYKNPFEFVPELKLWLATNHKPEIEGTDEGIWRRIVLVPFEVQFWRNDDPRRPENAPLVDPGLKAALIEELPGILAWAVQGCLEWQRDGLKPPPEVLAATGAYRAEMDRLSDFLTECCDLHRSYSAKAAELYDRYKRWCQENGEEAQSSTAFGRALTERGFARDQLGGGGRVRRGLALKDEP